MWTVKLHELRSINGKRRAPREAKSRYGIMPPQHMYIAIAITITIIITVASRTGISACSLPLIKLKLKLGRPALSCCD